MEEVYQRLYVGGDPDYAKIAHRPGWSVLRCCKYGQGGHQDILGYTTLAAPKGPHYLWAVKGKNHMALNLLDLDDPNYIDPSMIQEGLNFIQQRLAIGDKVLVCCNKGHSRGPSTALMFLRMIGDMRSGFAQSERVFHTLYPYYDPGMGIRQFARSYWGELKDTQ
jgi:hypothetical protein